MSASASPTVKVTLFTAHARARFLKSLTWSTGRAHALVTAAGSASCVSPHLVPIDLYAEARLCRYFDESVHSPQGPHENLFPQRVLSDIILDERRPRHVLCVRMGGARGDEMHRGSKADSGPPDMRRQSDVMGLCEVGNTSPLPEAAAQRQVRLDHI